MLPFYEYRDEPFFARKQQDDGAFPAHLHLSLELLYVNEGVKRIQIKDKKYIVKKGEMAVVFPNTIHAYLDPEDGDGNTVVTIVIFNQAGCTELKNNLLSLCPATPVVAAENIHKDVLYGISALTESWAAKESKKIASIYMQMIMERVCPFLNLTKTYDAISKSLPGNILMYISENFRNKISLEILSKEFSVSKEHISRIFSSTVNMRFNTYINSMRINYSKELLLTTDMDILTIGMESGFDNQQTFNRVFRELTDMSPKEYRKSNLNRE